MSNRLLKEPLVHFALLALAIFAAYRLITPAPAQGGADGIVISQARLGQMAEVFTKTWQRSPSPQELKELVDDYVREEIYVREALGLGLDKDDSVIRRRLRQKMEFLIDAADDVEPTDSDLQAYLEAHPEKFEAAPLLSFQQVYISPERHPGKMGEDAAAVLGALQGQPPPDPAGLGDGSLLPATMTGAAPDVISGTFGTDFADAIGKAAPGAWIGPIPSAYGLHLVRVLQHRKGRLPALDEIRADVLREWREDRRQARKEAHLDALLKHYQVTIEQPSGSGEGP